MCTDRVFCRGFWALWLALGGFAYVALSVAGVLWPQYQGKVFTVSQPAFFGEIALMLWLVIKGAKPRVVGAAESSVGAAQGALLAF